MVELSTNHFLLYWFITKRWNHGDWDSTKLKCQIDKKKGLRNSTESKFGDQVQWIGPNATEFAWKMITFWSKFYLGLFPRNRLSICCPFYWHICITSEWINCSHVTPYSVMDISQHWSRFRLPDGTRPFSDLMLICHRWDPVARN